MTVIRTLAFGDAHPGRWGVAWIPAGEAAAGIALAAGQDASVVSATVAADAGERQWRVQAPGADLLVSPLPEVVPISSPEASAEGLDQLCRVSGRLDVSGSSGEIECLGWRTVRTLALEDDRIGSFRQVWAWFDGDEGLSLLATRPRKSRGQDSDQIAASLVEPDGAGAIFDPRLSTTYRDDGRPTRAGIELWVGPKDRSSDGTDQAESGSASSPTGGPEQHPGEVADPHYSGQEHGGHQYPRRLAGEARGGYVDWAVGDFELHAAPFGWHSRGREGAGVYLLGLRR